MGLRYSEILSGLFVVHKENLIPSTSTDTRIRNFSAEEQDQRAGLYINYFDEFLNRNTQRGEENANLEDRSKFLK